MQDEGETESLNFTTDVFLQLQQDARLDFIHLLGPPNCIALMQVDQASRRTLRAVSSVWTRLRLGRPVRMPPPLIWKCGKDLSIVSFESECTNSLYTDSLLHLPETMTRLAFRGTSFETKVLTEVLKRQLQHIVLLDLKEEVQLVLANMLSECRGLVSLDVTLRALPGYCTPEKKKKKTATITTVEQLECLEKYLASLNRIIIRDADAPAISTWWLGSKKRRVSTAAESASLGRRYCATSWPMWR